VTITPPVSQKSGLALFWAVTFATTWAFWFVAIKLGGPAMSSPTVIPYLLGGFGPVFGALVIRARRARRREPAPAHTVRLRLSMRLFWVPPLLVMASATVLAAALLAHLVGGPAVSLTAGQNLIATAGGLVAHEGTFAELLDYAHVIWLQASPADHMRRVMEQGDFRPMADNHDAMKDLVSILDARAASYGRAHARLDTSILDLAQCVDELTLLAARMFGQA